MLLNANISIFCYQSSYQNILLERVTHEHYGDMTHDPTQIKNPPKIDDFIHNLETYQKDINAW